MGLCDVIVPVYKSPDWLKLCVYSIIKNTNPEDLNCIYLINDCNDSMTKNCLYNLKEKYGKKISIIENEKNLGFVKSTNEGMKASKADYVLLLNTDCIVAKNTIGKLISHMKKDEKIGLISPVASNAANITLPMYTGFTFMMMDQLLERKFLGKNFDACTIVGNCLMISRKCISEVGYLDEIYGSGYGEETDYQFKAMQKGFSAKIAIDTYVFHKSEASFGKSKEKVEKQQKNAKLFFDRWGTEYYKLMDSYKKNDPIEYINSNISKEDKIPYLKTIIYLMGIVENAGGVNVSIDIVNYLSINNININILYGFKTDYNEIMLFNPVQLDDLNKIEFETITSTIYYTTYYAKCLADGKNIPTLYLAQGYEPYFENGANYAIAELSYKIADNIVTVSNYLSKKYKEMFTVDSKVITNGINYDLIHNQKDYKNNNNKKVITAFLRGTPMKGDFILLDIIKKISKELENVKINVVCSGKNVLLPFNNNKSVEINQINGPLSRMEVYEIMRESDIYIDASINEGFGLMSLEAMAQGVVPITSNAGGNMEYLQDNKNGFVIEEVNNASKYFEKIKYLLNNPSEYKKISEQAIITSKSFDMDDMIKKYVEYFNGIFEKKNYKLTDEEKKIFDITMNMYFKNVNNSKLRRIKRFGKKCMSQKTRVRIKRIIKKVDSYLND